MGTIACQPCYPSANRPNYTNYSYKITDFSPRFGFGISDPNRQLDLDNLDILTARTLDCVRSKWSTMTLEQKESSLCSGLPLFNIQPCMTVVVPLDWYVSQCSGNEIFPCKVPDSSCLQKGEIPTGQCPCSCRAIIQDNDVIVTAPNLELYPARLTELLTGCNEIWNNPLKECGTP